MNPEIDERLARLYRLQAQGIKFDLDAMRALLERLDHPERALRMIHVAGTNGKGSVCAMLDSVWRAAGLRTGLYTSPHLVRFNERIRVNGHCIADEALAELIPTIETAADAAARAPHGRALTFFEFTTALAFLHFQRAGCELVVLETGMGGRLDATNTVTPLTSVITGISLEHTAYLGPDLPAIAREKAGIIKSGRPVVIGRLPGAARDVIATVARERQAPLIEAGQRIAIRRKQASLDGQKLSVSSTENEYGTFVLPLLGDAQIGNTAVALAALEATAPALGLSLAPDIVKQGLSRVRWPGRFQLIARDPPVVVDGAHNPEAAAALAQTVRNVLPDRPLALVFGLCADKDADGFLHPFAELVRHSWAVPLNTERSVPTAALAARARALGWPVIETSVAQALAEATAWARRERGVVCIAGSLFLAGEALARTVGVELA